MLLWTVLALMTGLAALALLWPLARGSAAVPGATASDVAIYKDQLAEIDRDRDRGLVGEPEAEAARIEVSRRLIQASRAAALPQAQATTGRRRIAALAVVVLVPAIGLALYHRLGGPGLPDRPLAPRLAGKAEDLPLDALVALVETQLSANPDDGKGWAVLAPIYRRSNRLPEAQQAYANALRLLGSTPEREADFGETTVLAAGGVVTAEARAAFQRALAVDPAQAKSVYFIGRAKEQDGDKDGALADWRGLLAKQQAGSPVAIFLTREIARLDGPAAPAPQDAPGPTAGDVAAAAALPAAEQRQMIEGMVAGLAGRLRDQGGGVEDWLRLVRAYAVLGQKDKAMAAAADARKALAASPQSVEAIDALTRSLGIEG